MSRTVDLHHHVVPDFSWEASNEGGNAAGGITPPRWSLVAAIAYLDEARIDVAVPSISTPGVHFGDGAAARHGERRGVLGASAARLIPRLAGASDAISPQGSRGKTPVG